MNASGCGATVRTTATCCATTPRMPPRPRISARTPTSRSCCPRWCPLRGRQPNLPVAPWPTTRRALQHGQRLRGGVGWHLRALGFDDATAAGVAHLCCGSAGFHSVLQAPLSAAARAKLGHLDTCARCDRQRQRWLHHTCRGGTPVPVRHWVELLDGRCRPLECYVKEAAGAFTVRL